MDEATRVAMTDQIQASLRERAMLAGYYFRSMRKERVPLLLAAVLVKDWHWWLHAPDVPDFHEGID